MTSPQDLARLRERLQTSDFRRLTFIAEVDLQDGLLAGLQAVAALGNELAAVDLSSAGFLDRDLDAATWRQRIVGRVAMDDDLHTQLERAIYLGLPAVIVGLSDELDPSALRAVAELVERAPTHVWLATPWSEAGWDRFDEARWFFAHHPKIHVALDTTSAPPAGDVVDRWCAEPIELLFASKPWVELQPLFQSVAERVFLTSPEHRPRIEATHRSAWSTVSARARHAAGFANNAILPVEPLGDDVSSATYELIESDPVKYRRYQEAARLVLQHKEDGAVVAVVGAGRGGLVDEVRRAARLVGRKIELLALEKNPGALRTLTARNRREWRDEVTIISADMRYWIPPKPIDLLVSELLGGFGDNELSPECLLPIERHLAADGVSIPRSYTSYIAPVFSSSLAMATKEREQLYTVALNRARLLAPAQPCFTFVHPDEHRLEQHASMRFVATMRGVVHGFGGFFETELAEDVRLSIVPDSHTEEMRSWSPMFFPIAEPFGVSVGDEIVVDFFRRTGAGRVWYEWVVSRPTKGRLHNANGRVYAMRS